MASGAEWNVIDRCLAVPADIERCRHALVNGKIDWLAVISSANDHFVGPALFNTLAQPQLRDLVPDDVRSYLQLIHARNAERNGKIRRQCLEIGATLASVGLRAVLLKGATWLFDNSVGPAADRMMRDIDLLVRADDMKAATDALLRAGYQDSSKAFLDDGHLHFEEHGHFHRAPLLPAAGEAIVEIHQDIAYRTDFLPAPELIEASVQVAPGLLLPDLRHRILHNVIHAQVLNADHLAGRFDLRDGLDLARLVDACGPGFDWYAFAEEARRRHYFPALCGAIHATHRILGGSMPAAFAKDRMGRFHGWRCENQRRFPILARAAGLVGSLKVGLTWDRDAYAFNLEGKPTFKDRYLVNVRRAVRLSSLVRGFVRRRISGYPTDSNRRSSQ
jgi:Uncharacterised nucleotidyltransferase